METTQNLFNVREVALSYSPNKTVFDGASIKGSSSAFNYLIEAFNKDTIGIQEEFNVLLLNNSNKPLGVYKVSKGGMCSTVVDVRLLMATALKSLATGVILSHNHPSGKLKASEADIQTTNNIKKACTIMNISLLDHLILDPFGGYMSFADEGLI
jgi:DNA repair protein RadC